MGADMCMAFLVKDYKRKLDWKAGERAIKKLKYKKDENGTETVDSDSGGEYTKDGLINYLDEVKSGFTTGRRDVTSIHVGHNEVIVSGGMSWGDSPTDFYTAVVALDDINQDGANILQAVGFNRAEDMMDYKKILTKILKIKTIIPALIGLDDELDKLISPKLKEA